MDTPPTPRSFHLLAKPTGAACNLDCSYCFFLSKAQLYPGSKLRMDDAGLEAYIRQLMEAQPGPEVAVAWQGGEPTLMGLPFFRRSVELVAQYCRPGVSIQYTMQTNGTRVDDEWAKFFKDNNFLVGLSVDGPRELHDHHRRTKGGGGSFDQVLAGWEALKRHDVDTNILCTVHADNGDHALPVYRFFRDELGARHLQFIPVIERATAATIDQTAAGWGDDHIATRPLYVQQGDRAAPRSVGPWQYGAFMTAIWDEWVRRDVGTVFVQAFDVALGNRLGRYALCVHAPTCGDALVLEHNGDLYSCDHYVEPDYRLGNIHETPLVELVASPRQRQFGQDKQDTLPRYCRECDVLQQCYGGCPKDRFAKTPNGEPGLNYLCEGYQAFFRNIAPAVDFMAGELLSGRPPAAVMGEMARRDREMTAAVAATGRNDPCPCGSGRKVKHCHGAR
jgi:uncharacterized protein